MTFSFQQRHFLPNGNHVDGLLVLLVGLLHVGDAGLVEILYSVLKEHRAPFDEVGNHAGVSPGQLHTKVRSNTKNENTQKHSGVNFTIHKPIPLHVAQQLF